MFTLNRKPLRSKRESTAERKWSRVAGSDSSAQVSRSCGSCGLMFTTWVRYDKRGPSRGRYCSRVCAGAASQRRVSKTCLVCGKQFTVHQCRIGKACSPECQRALKNTEMVARNADKPIKDRYGRTNRKADADWRKAIKVRDGYRCQRCNKVDKFNHAHHVAPRARRPDLRHDLSNGKTLCNSCHSNVHAHPIEAAEEGFLSTESYELAKRKHSTELTFET